VQHPDESPHEDGRCADSQDNRGYNVHFKQVLPSDSRSRDEVWGNATQQ
jgi:hypothetical protein